MNTNPTPAPGSRSDPPDWHTPLVAAWRDERGIEQTITVRLIETFAGGIQIALVVPPRNIPGEPLILALEIVDQVELNLRDTLVDRFRRAIGGLGGAGS